MNTKRADEIKLKLWTTLPHFRFSEARTTCRKEALEKVREPVLRVFEELTSVVDDSTTCKEQTGKMCPEGTMPEINRHADLAHGAKVATGIAIAFEVGKMVIGGVLGAALAGPAGLVAGIVKGVGIGAVLPGTTPITAAAFAWGSLGDEECACFPRECAYDSELGTCRIGTDQDSQSNNPFSHKVPYLSTKCVQVGNSSQPKCEMQKCEEEDYDRALLRLSGRLEHYQLFGTVGMHGGDLFNCLSNDGHSTGALPMHVDIWPDEVNTAAARAEIFQSLSLEGSR